jgi:hypothetical protein
MSRLPTCVSAILVFGLTIAVECFAPATARAYRAQISYTAQISWDCGRGWDLCMQACDYSVPGGPLLGNCNDYCSKGTSVCEASRIPLPERYRSHSRYTIDRE